jgi:transposase
VGRPAKYPEQFRRDAIDLVESSGRPIAEVARSLGISEGTLWNWVRAHRTAKARDADPDGLTESERDELRRLRKEVVELRTDKEILRRAAAYFARETMR